MISLSVGEGGPQARDVGGINDVQRLLGGIEQEGDSLGPADADVTVAVFNDIQCTTCADYQVEVVDRLVDAYARPGRARLEFHHFSIAPNDTTLAAIASEAAGEQQRQWQYIDLFVRNQELASERGVSDELLRELAEAVPQIDLDAWDDAYSDPSSEELVRRDAMLANDLELPAEPAVVVNGPGGQRELVESPSLAEVEAAIAAVS